MTDQLCCWPHEAVSAGHTISPAGRPLPGLAAVAQSGGCAGAGRWFARL